MFFPTRTFDASDFSHPHGTPIENTACNESLTRNYTIWGDNRAYMQNCGIVNHMISCEYCGYQTFIVACDNGIYRYNTTGKPAWYTTNWERVLKSPDTYLKRNPVRVFDPD